MSEVVNEAVTALKAKLGDGGFDSVVKFTINGEGSVMVDANGVRAGDDEADCTLSADSDTFQSIMDGSLNPTAAFMSGKLAVDGDMGIAMKLGAALA
ncbi:MAG: SCP2 sterol-binding domain-containing protein [Rhodobacteraceae bacterium]|nr:SCP2 sterol-binding domain-containing protein [Paracoccaceae bacterium]